MANTVGGNLPLDTNKPVNVTTNYFNNFFKPELATSQNIDNSIMAYFESITGNKDSAKVLASTVLYTALTQGLDPLTVVTEMSKLSKKNQQTQNSYTNIKANTDDQYANPGPNSRPVGISELNTYLTVFLNLNRVNTSLLGISNQPPTSKYISRAILP